MKIKQVALTMEIHDTLQTHYVFIEEESIMIGNIPDDLALDENIRSKVKSIIERYGYTIVKFEPTIPSEKLGWSFYFDVCILCPKEGCDAVLIFPVFYDNDEFRRCSECDGWYNISVDPPVFYKGKILVFKEL